MSNTRKKYLSKNDRYGNWILIENLDGGKGGNGIVWKVRNVKDDSLAAIKFLQPRHYLNNKRLQRFKDEILSMDECKDIKGVLKLLDFHAPAKPTVNNPLWFVSELAIPLEKVINEESDLIQIVEACCSFSRTLTEMHSRKVYHRDIKPDNLFLLENEWVIGDFGLVEYPEKISITSKTERLGPLFYLAPEMLLDSLNAEGSSADVWSLAKTLWKLGTNQRYPIEGTLRQDINSLKLSTYSSNEHSYKLDPILEAATNIVPENRIKMSQFCLELDSWLDSFRENKKNDSKMKKPEFFRDRLSNMWLNAKKKNQEKNIVNEKMQKLKTKIDSIASKCRNEIVNKIDQQIEETGMEHDITNSNSVFSSFMANINNPVFPKKSNDNYQNGALSIVYPPVLSETYLTGLLYGIGINSDLNYNATLIFGFWRHDMNRGRGTNKYSTSPYWVETTETTLNGPVFERTIEELLSKLTDKFPLAFEQFLDDTKEYNIPRQILRKN